MSKSTTTKKKQQKKPWVSNSVFQKTRAQFEQAKRQERRGKWNEAVQMFEGILEQNPHDAPTHLALARLEARREQDQRRRVRKKVPAEQTSAARQAFETGTAHRPDSVHLWQAWALYEQQLGNFDRARELFAEAMELEPYNPYVLHGYGLMEKKLGNTGRAMDLWKQALPHSPTAAVVCSLGDLYIAEGQLEEARHCFAKHVLGIKSNREKTEVYLAAAWLEEKHFSDVARAMELIQLAIQVGPSEGRALMALARLEGRLNRRRNKSGRDSIKKRLSETCSQIEKGNTEVPSDGRLFNAWAQIEVKSKHYGLARKILRQGIERFPDDKQLLLSAGKVEERVGNHTGARDFLTASLDIESSAPTLLALAQLEMKSRGTNMTAAKALFEEALMVDPRHGPVYNAYGNMEFRRGNVDEARRIFQEGIRAECNDAVSVYHGLGKIELSSGNVEVARQIFQQGLNQFSTLSNRGIDTSLNERVVFLYHTLGMLELNSDRTVEALDVFTSGIEEVGNCSQLLLGCALCEVKLGSSSRARPWFKRAVLADKRHAHAWQAWGVMECRSGNFELSQQLYEAGLKDNPHHGALWHAYAILEAKHQGRPENARLLFKTGIKKAPKHLPLYQGWASLEMREGDFKLAREIISNSLTRDKRQGPGWLVASMIEERAGNEGLAQLMLRRGIECCPREASLYRELGEKLVSQRKIREARDIMERGLDINPKYAPLYHSLAELEARICNVEALSELNKRAAKIFNSNALEASQTSSQAFGDRIRREQEPLEKAPLPEEFEIQGQDEEPVAMEGQDLLLKQKRFMNSRRLEEEIISDVLSDDLPRNTTQS